MKKYKKIIELLFMLILLIVATISLIRYFNAELIVDKIHYGFLLMGILIYLCSNNNNNNTHCYN